MSRPCSSHVYQDSPTPASWATSSRRRPGVRRRPFAGRPTSCGVTCARRVRRKSVSSERRVSEGGGASPTIDALLVTPADRSAPWMHAHTTRTAKLGDHDVRRIGFGAMQLAGPGVFGPPRDRDAALAVLRRAVELGVDHIDTSQYYGPDVVNELIREALHPYPDGPAPRDEGRRAPRRPGRVAARAAPRRAARRRRGQPPRARRRAADARQPAPARRRARRRRRPAARRDARRAGGPAPGGQARAHRPVERRRAHSSRRRSTSSRSPACRTSYSILDRSNEDVLEACRERGLAFVPFFPLGSAFTGGPQRLAEDPAIARVAAKHGATPSQVALAWLLHRDERILLIPGHVVGRPPRGEPGRGRRRARRRRPGRARGRRARRRPARGRAPLSAGAG